MRKILCWTVTVNTLIISMSSTGFAAKIEDKSALTIQRFFRNHLNSPTYLRMKAEKRYIENLSRTFSNPQTIENRLALGAYNKTKAEENFKINQNVVLFSLPLDVQGKILRYLAPHELSNFACSSQRSDQLANSRILRDRHQREMALKDLLSSNDDQSWRKALSILTPLLSSDEEVQDAFIERLKNSTNEGLRFWAATRLADSAQSANEHDRQKIVCALATAINDPHPSVSAAASDGLEKLSPKDHTIVRQGSLIGLKSDDSQTWNKAVSKLAPLLSSDEEVQDAFIERLKNSTNEIFRSWAATRLADSAQSANEHDRQKIVCALATAINDPHPSVSAAATDGLEKLSPKDHTIVRQESLIGLNSNDSQTWNKAVSKLAPLLSSDEEVQDAFIDILDNSTDENRRSWAAIQLAAAVGPENEDARRKIFHALSAAMNDTSPLVRQSILKNINNLKRYY